MSPAPAKPIEPLPLDDVEIDDDVEADCSHEHIVAYRLDGALFFGAAQRFLTELTAVSDVRVVILRLPRSRCSTPPAPRRSARSSASSKPADITVLLKGARPEHLRILEPSAPSTASPTNATSSTTSTTPSPTPDST